MSSAAAPALAPVRSDSKDIGVRVVGLQPSTPDASPPWRAENVLASLEAVHAKVAAQAEEAIAWYKANKRSKSRWARVLRALAIIFTTTGALIPVVVSLPIVISTNIAMEKWAFVVLALAAACIGIDKFYGLSSGWVRYMRSAQTIEKDLYSFELSWVAAMARLGGAVPSPGQVVEFLKLCSDFLTQVMKEIELETKQWIVEFQSSLADLEKSTEAQREASRPGSVMAPAPTPADRNSGVEAFPAAGAAPLPAVAWTQVESSRSTRPPEIGTKAETAPNFKGGGRPFDQGAMDQCCGRLGVKPEELWAVIKVETRGFGFLADRRPQILFERHKFSERTGGRWDSTHPDISNSDSGGYAGGPAEYTRLAAAIALDRTAALESTSWGIGQVMGFNHKAVGFATVDDMVSAMVHDEGSQLLAVANFIGSQGLDDALRRHDWDAFALVYNGKGYRENKYAQRLNTEYEKCRSRLPDFRVRTAQAALTYLGIDPGAVDGLQGPRTRAALMAFQQRHGLTASGELNDGTEAALLAEAFPAAAGAVAA